MPKTLHIPQTFQPIQIPFDRVKEYAVLTGLRSDEGLNQLRIKGLSLTLDLEFKDGSTQSSPIHIWRPEDINKGQLEEIYIPLRFSDAKRAFLSAKFNLSKNNVLDSPLFIEYEIIDKLEMQIPDAGFTEHLGDVRNHKILFSGKFGQGKSTFLDYYFKEREEQYNVFRLFPVNYSVSSNEDIFRYIKCELIFQLLSKDIEFNKVETSHSNALKTFAKKNLDKAIAPLLLLAPKVGRNMFQMFEKYKELSLEYQNFHKQLNIDESLLAHDYVETFYESEGGLFEDDFYTHLIRSQIENLKDKSPQKGNVLIIDDLDRMDPEHIFRILNVFSAHFDRLHLGGESSYDKFGFDRIILVCDYENLRHIYEYKYGEKVDFPGYINKYFSTKKFEFNSAEVAFVLIENIDDLNPNQEERDSEQYSYFKMFAYEFYNKGILSLRDLYQLRSISIEKIVSKLYFLNESRRIHNEAFCVFTPAFSLIGLMLGFDTLIKEIEKIDLDFLGDKSSRVMHYIQILKSFSGSTSSNERFKIKNDLINVSFRRQNSYYYPTRLIKLEGSIKTEIYEDEIDISNEDLRFEMVRLLNKINNVKHLL